MKFLRKFPYLFVLVFPFLLTALGAASNQAVFLANAGKFPVRMNASWMDSKCSLRGIDPDDAEDIPASSCRKGGEMIDARHSVMGPNSNLKILADVFNFGGMYSIGDGLIFLGDWLQTFVPFIWIGLALGKLYKAEGELCPSKV